jgi:predicted DNA-binding protein with PD1-like motif
MTTTSVQSGVMQAHAIRIHAGEDLVLSLSKAAFEAMEKSGSKSAFMMTAVGSLETVTLRMANACKVGENPENSPNEIKEWKERLEIVSLVGTFSADGYHLHMSVSDKNGNVFGGHVIAGTIFTTLELVFGTISNVAFSREQDDKTGYDELVVRSS